MSHPDAAMVAAPRSGIERIAGIVGLAGVLVAVIACGWLDLRTGADIYRATVSAYVFTDPVVFTSAVIALVVGSVAILIGLLRAGVATGRSASTWLLSAWIAGMTAVAIFPKHDWSVGPSFSGNVHRIGSLVAFVALPLAVLLLTRRGLGVFGYVASGFGLAAYAYVGYLVAAIAASEVTWWRAVPLGLSERILLLLEVAALAALAAGLLMRSRRAPH